MDQSTGIVTIADGETVQVEFLLTIRQMMDAGSILPVAQETTFGVTGFSPAAPASLTSESASQRWSFDPANSGVAGCTNGQVTTPTYTAPANDCHWYVFYYWTQEVTNDSGADVTWDLPIETAKLTINGTPTDKVDLSLSQQYSLWSYQTSVGAMAHFSAEDAEAGIVLTAADRYLYTSFAAMCLDSTVQTGDVLTWEAVATADGVDIPVGYAQSGMYIDWNVPDVPFGGYGTPASFTASSGSGSQAANMSGNVKSISANEAGQTILISLALTNANGDIVSGACAQGGGGGGGGGSSYVTMAPMSASAVAKKTPLKGILIGNKSLASGFGIAAPGTAPDPSGGVFYWATNGGPQGSTGTVQALGSTGPKAIGGKKTKQLAITLPNLSSLSSFGWYGKKRDKWAGVAQIMSGMAPTYALITGKLSAQAGSSKTLSLGAICSQGEMTNVSVLSAPIESVYLQIVCFNMQANTAKTHVAKVAGSATLTATKVASLGATTDAKPCGYGGIGVNPKASGSNAAIVVYGAIGPATTVPPMPMAQCLGASQSNRTLTTIPANGGAAKTVTVATSPFGATEPTVVTLAAGKAANTWIGFAHTGRGTYNPIAGVTISAKGVIAKKKVSVPTATGFAAGVGGIVTPVLEVSPTKWIVSRVQTNRGETGTSNVVTLGSYSPNSGSIASGQALNVSGISMQTWGGSQILTPSSVVMGSKVYLNYYGLTAAGKYSVGQWWASSKS